ncbi:unnamed protein product [Rhizophagus irregularis]|nr:unnamed protein product [Rhizophagus irregularis]
MEYENPKNNPMVENDKDDSILDSDEGEYHDTNVEITLWSEQFLIDDSTYKDGFREYDYEIKQILLKNLIKSVPLGSICGCPPKRYQSEGESQKIIKENKENQSVNTNDSTLKKLRKCRSFQETVHDLQNCKVLSEKN